MKRIVWRFLVRNDSRGAFGAFLLLGGLAVGPCAAASVRPQIGGTLRVEMSERLATIDPRQWPVGAVQAGAAERVDSLVFDRLVRVDERGALQPVLAISWEHDAPSKRWQFHLRNGVKFSDGVSLTPSIAAMALQQLLGISFDVSASSDSVVIQTDRPVPQLATELSSGRYFIFRVAEDNSLVGTGPFRVSEWPGHEATAKAVLVANEMCWAGRPFVDKIELTMGVNFEQEGNAIAFGQADVVELPSSDVRRAAQRGVRTASSDPVELFALVLDVSRPALLNVQTRQAISLSIDRISIADVILQKQGIASGGLLPNWISGYAHLFPPAFDVARSRDLLTVSKRELSRLAPLALVYDSTDVEAHAVADRVAVNLREVGILVQVSGSSAERNPKSPAVDLRLVRRRLGGPDAAAALSELLPSLGETASSVALEAIEQAYEAERAPLGAYRIIPLVHVSESFALSPQVRDWMAPRWGGWDLADVWLGPPPDTGSVVP